MLALCLMLSGTYYAQKYAGIIGLALITSIDLHTTQSNYLIRGLAAMAFDMGNYMNFANKTAHEIFSMHENLKMITTSCKACTANYCEYLIAMQQNFAYLCSGMSRAGQAVPFVCWVLPCTKTRDQMLQQDSRIISLVVSMQVLIVPSQLKKLCLVNHWLPILSVCLYFKCA